MLIFSDLLYLSAQIWATAEFWALKFSNLLKLCTHILCLCSDILIVWGIFSLIMSRFVRSFSATCYIWAPKFGRLLNFERSNLVTCRFLALKISDPLYLYTRSKASLQIERPPSFVRLNFGDRWILSAQNRRLAVFVRGRDTYSTNLLVWASCKRLKIVKLR